MDQESFVESIDRLLAHVRQVAFVGEPAQQLGASLRRHVGGEPQRPTVLVLRLAVGAHRSGLLCGGGSEPQHRVAVARRVSVMGKPGEVRLAVPWLLQGGQRAPMQAEPHVGSQ